MMQTHLGQPPTQRSIQMRLFYAKVTDHLFIGFRRKRMKQFLAQFSLSASTRVLDIGGTPQTWNREAGTCAPECVVLANIRTVDEDPTGRCIAMYGDATALPFADGSFDLVFSNSVIEHVGTWEKQKAFAREARRVAPQLWIQTPARSFPIEAHLLAPFIQYLPKGVQRRLARWTPRGLLQPAVAREVVEEVRLLSYREFKLLFPDCLILKERFFGMTKSYIAVRR